MLRDVVVVGRTRPWSKPVAILPWEKNCMGCHFYACMRSCFYSYGPPLGGLSGRRSSATKFYMKGSWLLNDYWLTTTFLLHLKASLQNLFDPTKGTREQLVNIPGKILEVTCYIYIMYRHRIKTEKKPIILDGANIPDKERAEWTY